MILVGVDAVSASATALRWAAAEAALRHEPLRVVHVVPLVVDYVGHTDDDPRVRDTEHRHLEAFVDAVLGATPYVGTSLIAEVGDPPEVLLDLADSARIVVVGRPVRAFHPGRTGVVRLLLDRSTATVVVVPPEPAHPAADTILVGADDSPDGYAATRFALAEAARRGVGVHAIHALPLTSLVAAGVESVAVVESAVGHATCVLDEVVSAARRHVGHDVPVDAEVVLAPAADALVAASAHAALLVVGTRERHALSRALLGSTSRRCVERAHCPVAVVPGALRVEVPQQLRTTLEVAR